MESTNYISLRRSIGFILLALLVLFAVQFFAFGQKSEVALADAGGTTVFYKNTDGWASPYIYYWGTNITAPSWTGTPTMTLIGGSGNSGWWAFNIPGNTTSNVIFKDSNKSPDPDNRTSDQLNRPSNTWFTKTAGSGQQGGNWSSTFPDADTTNPTFNGQPWITSSTTGGTSLTVNWRPATDTSGIDKYEVLRDGSVVDTIYASTQNNTRATYKGGVTQYSIPTSYSLAQTSLTPTTLYKYEVKAYDYKGLSTTSPAIYVAPGAYAKSSPTFDGWDDYNDNTNGNSNETFSTTSNDHTSYLSWDGQYIYYGYQGPDVTSVTGNKASKWILSYIGGSGGATSGINYTGQQPSLPFTAKYHMRYKVDGTYYNRQVANGSTWSDAQNYSGEQWGSGCPNNWCRQDSGAGAMVEFRIPRADLVGVNGTSLAWVSSIIYENASGSTWAGVPSNAFTAGNGFDKDFDLFYEFDLTSQTAAAAQWYNYEFRKNSVNGKSVSFTMKGGISDATSVKIQQSSDSGVTWSDSSLVNAITGTSTSAIVKGLSPTTTYKFRFVVTGGTKAGSSTIETATTGSNSTPVATTGTLSATEDTQATGTLAGTDDDYDSLSYSIVGNPSNGTVNITNASTGAYTYTPNSNYNGSDSFTFRVNDGTANSTNATITVTIAAVNDTPTISDVANQSINEDGNTGALAVTVGDVETAAGSLTMSGSSSNTTVVPNGNIVFAGSGANRTVTVTPAANQYGTVTITISVSDGSLSASDTFTLTIASVNDSPTITDVANITIDEDNASSALAITISDIETGVGSLTMSGSSSDTALIPNGNIVFGGSGANRTVTVTPAVDKNGTATITITVTDSNGGTASDTFTVTVNPINDAPTISDTTDKSTNEDTATTSISFTVGDAESAAGTLTLGGSSSNKTLVPDANIVFGGSGASRSVVITPAANLSGTSTITITVSDGSLTTSDTFVLTVNAVNDAPTATAGTLTVTEDTTANGTLTGSDIEGSSLSFSVGTQGSKGTVTITNQATGAYSYAPNANATGSDSFTFKVNDGTTDSAAATITVTINAVNDAPTATAGTLTVTEDETKNATLSGSDVDGDSITFSVVSQGEKGTVNITNSSSGAYNYVPNANANGSDSFTFRVNDGLLNSSTVTITVTINAVNDAPTASAGTLSVTEDSNQTGTLSGSDIDGNSLTYSVVTQGAKGTVTITNVLTGAYSYVPSANANGSDSFTFKVNDGTVDSSSATITVTITAVNDAPTAAAGTLSVTEDTTQTGTLSGSDIDGNSLTYSVATQGSKGTVTITNINTGAYSFVPSANATGSDSFTFKVNDGTADSTAATITVTISAVNDAPTISDVTNKSTDEDTPTSAIAITVDDIDSTVANLTMSGTSSNTTLVPNANIVFGGSGANRTVTITPASGLSGSATITITVSDGSLSASDTFVLTVASVNDSPTISDITNKTTNEDVALTSVSFTVGDTETAVGSLTVSGTSSNTALVPNGNITFGGSGASRTVSITPAANQNGTTTITITVTDGGSLSTSDTFLLTVSAVNDAPTLTTISTISGSSEDTATNILFADFAAAANEADIDGDTLSFKIINVSSGTLTKGGVPITPDSTTFSAGETLVWQPAANANGTLPAFTVRAVDTSSTSSASDVTVNISVAAVNDPPTLTSASNLTGAFENALYEITYANLLAAANEADVDSSTFTFRIEEVTTGTITKGGNAVVAGTTTLSAGESLIWNQGTLDAPGTIPAFKIRVSDGTAYSTTAAVSVSIVVADDVTAPSFPTGLTLSSNTTSSITLSWNAVIDSGLGTLKYIVYFNGENQQEVTGTTLTISSLPENTTYSGITVKAKDQAGNVSGASNSISARTKDGTAPNAPTNVAIGNKSGTGFEVSWTAGSDNVGGSGVKEYEVMVGANVVGTTANTSYTVTGLTEFTQYDVKVRTVDTDNNKSSWTTPLSVRTNDTSAPTQPTQVAASGINATVFTLNWTASTDNVGVAFYDIYFDANLTPVASVAGTTYTATGMIINTPVSVTIKARDAAGNVSSASTALSVTPVDTEKPAEPSGILISNKQQTQFTLNWTPTTDNVGVTEYKVYVNEVLRTTILPNQSGALATTYVVTNVVEGNTYEIEIVAKDAAGNSSDAGTINVSMTDINPPTWPTPNSRTVDSRTFNSLTIIWTAATDVSGIDQGSGIDYYVLTVTGGPGAGSVTSETNQKTLTGLKPNTEYTITVVAIDGSGLASAATTPLTVKTVLDVILPPIPADLELTASTPSTVTLSWDSVVDNDILKGYNVYGRLKISEGVYRTAELLKANVTTTTTTVTGLLPDRDYRFFVRAVDRSDNLSGATNFVDHGMAEDVEPPIFPNGFVPVASEVTETTMKVSWTGAFTDNVDSVANDTIRFELFVNNVKLSIPKIPFRDTEYTITGLKQDTTYAIKVRAWDNSNNASEYTGVLNQKTNKDVINPTKPVVTTGTAAVSTNKITWTASQDTNLVKYEIHVAKPQGNPVQWTFAKVADVNVPVAPLEFTMKNLDPNITGYKVKVIAVDAAGNKNESDEKSFNTMADTIAPSLPADLSLERIDPTSFTFSWKHSTDNHAVAGYEIFYLPVGALNSTPWQKINTDELVQENSFEVTLNDVATLNQPAGVYYRVVAYDPTGNFSSNRSDTVRTGFLVKYADVTPPTAPTNVNKTEPSVKSTSFELTWTASTDPASNPSSGVAKYKIYVGDEWVATTTALKFTVTGLTPETEYSGESAISVSAVDGAGNESEKAALTQVVTTADDVPPAKPTVKFIGSTYNSLTFELTATDNIAVTGYEYRVGSTGNFIATGNPLKITGLTPGLTVAIQVKSIDAEGNRSTLTGNASGTTIDDTVKPTAPLLSGVQYVDSILLRWKSGDDNFEVKGYQVYQVNGSKFDKIGAELPADTTTYEISGLQPDTSYRYIVRTIDTKNNQSLNSNIATFTTNIDSMYWTPDISIKTPIDTNPNNDGSKFTIQWTKPAETNFLYYELFLNGVIYNSTKPNSAEDWTIERLKPLTEYTAVIRYKIDDQVYSSFSNALTVTAAEDKIAPYGLSASLTTEIKASSMKLRWNPASDNVAVAEYRIFKNDQQIGSTENTEFVATGLTKSTSHTFTVKAVDTSGNESAAITITASTIADKTAPTPPGAGQFTVSEAVRSGLVAGFKVTWEDATDDTVEGNEAFTYLVFLNGVKMTKSPISDKFYTFSGLKFGTQYKISVAAIDNDTNTSAPGTPFLYTTLGDNVAPTAPTDLDTMDITSTSATITWTAAEDDVDVFVDYVLKVNGVVIGTTKKTRITVKLMPDSEQLVYVYAVDAANNESTPATISVSTSDDEQRPEAPLGVTVQYPSTTGKIKISWLPAYDNDQIKKYVIRDAFDNSAIVNETQSLSFHEMNASVLNGKTIYVEAVDRSDNPSEEKHLIKVNTDNNSADLDETVVNVTGSPVTYTNLYTRTLATVTYKTKSTTTMTLRLIRDDNQNGEKDDASVITMMNNQTVPGGSKTIKFSNLNTSGKYIVEFKIASGAMLREYNTLLIVDKATPVLEADPSKFFILTDIGPSASSTVDIEYTASKNMVATVTINNANKETVRYIHNESRILKKTATNYVFTWNGKTQKGMDVLDGKYTVEFSGTDILGMKTVKKSKVLLVERARPVISNLKSNYKPATSLSLTYNLSEAGVVRDAFKLCITEPVDGNNNGKIDSSECEVVPDAVISGSDGAKKPGLNKFSVKLKTMPAHGTTYYIWADVRDLSNNNPDLAKDNAQKVFSITFDNVKPIVSQFAASNVVGSNTGSITYHLNENAIVSMSIKSGVSYEKSKLVRTLLKSQLITASASEEDLKTVSWDGKDEKKKAVPNTTNQVKYFVEIVVTDLAGNMFTATQNAPSWLEITKLPAS